MANRAIEQSITIPFGEECHAGYERGDNQDRVVHGQTPFGTLFAVSDGVGGNQDGALAAATVVAELLGSLQQQHEGSAKQALATAVQHANSRVYQEGVSRNTGDTTQRTMSATVVAALVDTARECPVAIIANVGDSRAYLLREGLLSQISTDHTAVQSMVVLGVLTPEQAEGHPQSSVLTRSMGQRPDSKPSIERVLLKGGDELLLCSDGLHGYVPEAAILAEMVRPGSSPPAKASALLQLALAAGGRDNISVQVVGPMPIPDGSAEKHRQATEHTAAWHVAAGAAALPAPPAKAIPAAARMPAARYVLWTALAVAVLLGLAAGVYVYWQSRPVQRAGKPVLTASLQASHPAPYPRRCPRTVLANRA